MSSHTYRIEPLPGYSPVIGMLVGMLTYARDTTIAAVAGLTVAQLDHLQDDASNSIGALLAHFDAVERSYQRLTFQDRTPNANEMAVWQAALTLGDEGRRVLRGRPLDELLGELADARRITLEQLAARDDAWLARPLVAAAAMNAHFAWFHVAEDEVNHRGQIRWLRARLPHT
ncbi:DinB family protein [soil metagenome]